MIDFRARHCLLPVFLLLLLSAFGLSAQMQIAELGRYKGYNLNDYPGAELTTHYLSMRDSVQLATNVYLPKGLEPDHKIPTLLYLTRYHRAFDSAGFIAWANPYFHSTVGKKEIEFFTRHGYAIVIVDVRGTGASTGTRSMEFSAAEIADGQEIVDWIIAQSWSNQHVGSTGISYLGTTAQLLLVNQHPNVKAVINRSGVFDLYADITFPGGAKLERFIEVWRNSTYALDSYQFGYFGTLASLLLKGPMPVESDEGGNLLELAKEDHTGNFDIFPPLEEITCRDDVVAALGEAIDSYSPHRHLEAIEASQTPIFFLSGWYDGGNIRAAVHNYLACDNAVRLVIGPWDHGPKERISPFENNRKVEFQVYEEMLRFFDYYLYGIENGLPDAQPVAYFQMGQEAWREADNWPPETTKATFFYLSGDERLVSSAEHVIAGELTHDVNPEQSSGDGSRWNSLTPAFRYNKIGYPKWTKTVENLLTFTSSTLDQPLEITGHPVVHLEMSADAADAMVFVYLQDRAPDGSITYITEGQFRALHRKESEAEPPYPSFGPYHTFYQADAEPIISNKPFEVSFDLLPISYTLPIGHQLQLAVAGADIGHFELLENGAQELTVRTGGEKSFLTLPVQW